MKCPRRSQGEQKDMLRRELRCRGTWVYNYEINSIENPAYVAKEKAKAEADASFKSFNGQDVEGRSKECLLLLNFPEIRHIRIIRNTINNSPEIRNLIWRELFRRPVAFVPDYTRYKLSICYRDTKIAIYSYQWDSYDNRRQSMYEEYNLPNYDGTPGNVQIAWPTKATADQLVMIESGTFSEPNMDNECQLPSTYDEELGVDIHHHIHQRGDFGVQIINRASIQIAGLYGINILQTCKQIASEVTAILYGENTFTFDSRGTAPFTHHRGVHEHDAFKTFAHHVPGLPNKDGSPATQRQITYAINKDVRWIRHAS